MNINNLPGGYSMKKAMGYRVVSSLLAIVVSSSAMQGLLEKPLFVVRDGQVNSYQYWTIFFGTYPVSLMRKFPGEEEQPVETKININFLSNMYIEGNGYSSKGKIKAKVHLAVDDGTQQRRIMPDSIDYIWSNGRNVSLLDGTTGGLFLDIEGTMVQPKAMTLRHYTIMKEYGQTILKESEPEKKISISACSFSKKGINKALNAQE